MASTRPIWCGMLSLTARPHGDIGASEATRNLCHSDIKGVYATSQDLTRLVTDYVVSSSRTRRQRHIQLERMALHRSFLMEKKHRYHL